MSLDQPTQFVTPSSKKNRGPRPLDPFLKAVWRGTATILPPLVTVVILIWVVATINEYVFLPMTRTVRDMLFHATADIRLASQLPGAKAENGNEVVLDGKTYVRMKGGKYIPKEVVDYVRDELDEQLLSLDASEVYRLYIEARYLKPYLILPFLIAILILVLYILGKLVSARVGSLAWRLIDTAFERLPIVRSVYNAVKQVSDFIFVQRKVEFNRVVLVEYPRRGIWSIGLVTGEVFKPLEVKTGRKCLSVFVPTSPAPMTGYTVVVPPEHTIDVGISIDQAIQFVVSCGVVSPQLAQMGFAAMPVTHGAGSQANMAGMNPLVPPLGEDDEPSN